MAIDEKFEAYFQEITGFPTLRWQRRLFHQLSENRLPDALDLPTGLGKTSVMVLWLLARALNPALPRRLVYVVDRRVVVDQATQVAEELQTKLEQLPELKALLGFNQNESVSVSTLRGQFVDNRQWLADPTKAAIIVGTIDMIGSRLLFEGYGVSRNMRRYHAGFLGADSLCVLDEAHLCQPFEALLQAVASDKSLLPTVEQMLSIPPFKRLSLSATGKQGGNQAFGLQAEDYGDDVVAQRLNAKKELSIEIGNEGNPLPELLGAEAWDLKDSGNRILIFCNRREDARKIKADLENRFKQAKVKYPINFLTGGRRVRERQNLVAWLADYGFLAGSEAKHDTPVFLIATSAGEVGIDLDADHMACDLVAFERMVQRFGRVNRRGEKSACIKVVAIPPKAPTVKRPTVPDVFMPQPPSIPPENADKALLKQYKQEQQAFEKAQKIYQKVQEEYAQQLASYQQTAKAFEGYQAQLAVVKRLAGDASPGAITALKPKVPSDEMKAALSEELLRPALTRALVDAWSMTSLEQHTARPDIQPWLRGWQPNEEPETTLAWRQYLPWGYGDDFPNPAEVEAFFENAPIHLSETLEISVREAAKNLVKRAQETLKSDSNLSGKPALLLLTRAGKLAGNRSFTVQQLANVAELKELQVLLANRQAVITRFLGGLSNEGLLDDSADGEGLVTLDHQWDEHIVGYRVVCREYVVKAEGDWHTVYQFKPKADEDAEAVEIWLVQVYRGPKSQRQGDPAVARFEQSLQKHHDFAGREMKTIAQALALPADYADLVVAAMRRHDLGKQRGLWQTSMNAPPDGRPYAKTLGGGNPRLLAGYRHEFGSLADVANDAAINQLPTELQDLALHLIASHHGYACPVIAPIDPGAPPSVLAERAQQAALRFACLQRQWGPWGLAWWEAVFRAADHRASQISDEQAELEGKA
ncbi:type I-G CRISPR-associated helicase/endonuclease Cas3g [Methylomonas rivi]|uniref:Type I-U CRISPR-associated helicase/endonuclease Cas3 n=1 Tax=Methylomonas rivi TaxID=2952226 RepID=A0ABT1U6R9_9GAMM|nr:type I-U CRISPR-associated helicase/endonuclease Cas3 [Methylomonas sp. WSC-6]MCQ8129556.1 type I-U CRISPR-associated helicase/endonuclease Cas3 [Methylomonas sp. WSC-6]